MSPSNALQRWGQLQTSDGLLGSIVPKGSHGAFGSLVSWVPVTSLFIPSASCLPDFAAHGGSMIGQAKVCEQTGHRNASDDTC